MEWVKIFVHQIFNKGLTPPIHEDLSELNRKWQFTQRQGQGGTRRGGLRKRRQTQAARDMQMKTPTILAILPDASHAGQGVEKRDYPPTGDGRM